MGPRFRLDRPTRLARELRADANEIERLLWAHLRRSQLNGLKFSRQMPIASYVVDFVCRARKLVVELDGSQHADAVEYDARRTAEIESQGYRVIRFWNSDVLTNLDGVLAVIADAATDGERAPTPQRPLARGRGSR